MLFNAKHLQHFSFYCAALQLSYQFLRVVCQRGGKIPHLLMAVM